MTNIKPFKGLLYNKGVVKDLAKVVAPPYDIISSKMQGSLYKRDAYNVVRLELGKQYPSDNAANNRYSRAKETIGAWMRDGVLLFDGKPAIYAYRQDYSCKGKRKSQMGFLALIKLEDSKKGGVLKHEKTFAKPKRDRFKLISSTHANISPIFSLFFDDSSLVNKLLQDNTTGKAPYADIVYDGIRNRLWRVTDVSSIKAMQAFMKKRKAFIADGHHRYEVALAYRRAAGRSRPRAPRESDYAMMYFTALDEKALTVLATHRVVKYLDTSDGALADKLALFFDIKYHKGPKELLRVIEDRRSQCVFGVYTRKSGAISLSLKRGVSPDKLISIDRSSAWKHLDVAVLHELIFDKILRFKKRQKDNIIYTRDPAEAIALVDKRSAQAAFLLRPTKISQITDIASKGERMPHKSTYFYPKLLSGLVINRFTA